MTKNRLNDYINLENKLIDSDLSIPLKVSVLREELVNLTGDSNQAIVLNQFIYWSERTKTAAKFVKEEMLRVKKYTEENDTSVLSYLESDFKQGWIYKSANELIEDTMITISKPTMTRVINSLIEKGWIMKRKNPRYRGDNTPQYRVNLLKLQMDLYKLGYSLNGYKLIMNFVGFAELQKLEDKVSTNTNNEALFQNETTSTHYLTASIQNESMSLDNESPSKKNATTLPEITSKVTKDEEDEKNYNQKRDQHKHAELLNWIKKDPDYKNLVITLRQIQVDFENVYIILKYFVNNPSKFNKQVIKQQLVYMGERSKEENGISEFSTYFINGLERRLESNKINMLNESMLDEMLGLDKAEFPTITLHNWLEEEKR